MTLNNNTPAVLATRSFLNAAHALEAAAVHSATSNDWSMIATSCAGKPSFIPPHDGADYCNEVSVALSFNVRAAALANVERMLGNTTSAYAALELGGFHFRYEADEALALEPVVVAGRDCLEGVLARNLSSVLAESLTRSKSTTAVVVNRGQLVVLRRALVEARGENVDAWGRSTIGASWASLGKAIDAVDNADAVAALGAYDALESAEAGGAVRTLARAIRTKLRHAGAEHLETRAQLATLARLVGEVAEANAETSVDGDPLLCDVEHALRMQLEADILGDGDLERFVDFADAGEAPSTHAERQLARRAALAEALAHNGRQLVGVDIRRVGTFDSFGRSTTCFVAQLEAKVAELSVNRAERQLETFAAAAVLADAKVDEAEAAAAQADSDAEAAESTYYDAIDGDGLGHGDEAKVERLGDNMHAAAEAAQAAHDVLVETTKNANAAQLKAERLEANAADVEAAYNDAEADDADAGTSSARAQRLADKMDRTADAADYARREADAQLEAYDAAVEANADAAEASAQADAAAAALANVAPIVDAVERAKAHAETMREAADYSQNVASCIKTQLADLAADAAVDAVADRALESVESYDANDAHAAQLEADEDEAAAVEAEAQLAEAEADLAAALEVEAAHVADADALKFACATRGDLVGQIVGLEADLAAAVVEAKRDAADAADAAADAQLEAAHARGRDSWPSANAAALKASAEADAQLEDAARLGAEARAEAHDLTRELARRDDDLERMRAELAEARAEVETLTKRVAIYDEGLMVGTEAINRIAAERDEARAKIEADEAAAQSIFYDVRAELAEARAEVAELRAAKESN